MCLRQIKGGFICTGIRAGWWSSMCTASSTGQIIFIPMLGFIVASSGWRTASVMMAGIVALVGDTDDGADIDAFFEVVVA